MNEDINLALTLLNLALGWISRIKANNGLTADQLIAAAETQDLSNKDQIKALLAGG